jgi:TRAP-type mannitol/chloroaromatic compound transport system permease small subunit
MKIIKAILKVFDTITEWSGRIVVWVFVALLAITLFEVFTRRFLGSPTVWTFEILSYLFAAVVMLSLGYTHLHEGHARVDILTEKMSDKTQKLIEVIAYPFFLGLMTYIMFKDGLIYAGTAWRLLERAPSVFNSIVYPAKSMIPLGIGLLGIAGISRFIKNIVFLVKGENL